MYVCVNAPLELIVFQVVKKEDEQSASDGLMSVTRVRRSLGPEEVAAVLEHRRAKWDAQMERRKEVG